MASLRAVSSSSPLVRQLVRPGTVTATVKPTPARSRPQQHRLFSSTTRTRNNNNPPPTSPVLYSAHARVVGARTGHARVCDGDDGLRLDLAMAKALGGPSTKTKTKTTNPEELFAAGYGACFQSAMNASAASLGVRMPTTTEDSVVETTVYLVGDMKALDMGLRVDMKVKVRGLARADLERVVKRAEEVCPYSRATRGNVETKVEIVDFEEEGSGDDGGKKARDEADEPLSESKDGTKSYGTSTYG